ncbi:MAG: hypothetical protein F4059_03640 [Gemmatimonadetes bacterium]|nr:hypothetical protein [Gemmatimonadota bacterium]
MSSSKVAALLQIGHKSKGTWDLRRAVVAGIALSYMVVAVVLGPVDAILDAASLASPIHIESPQKTNCDSHHGHLICQVVRTPSLAGIAPLEFAANRPAPLVHYREMSREALEMKRAPILLGSVVPRGPPTA